MRRFEPTSSKNLKHQPTIETPSGYGNKIARCNILCFLRTSRSEKTVERLGILPYSRQRQNASSASPVDPKSSDVAPNFTKVKPELAHKLELQTRLQEINYAQNTQVLTNRIKNSKAVPNFENIQWANPSTFKTNADLIPTNNSKKMFENKKTETQLVSWY